MSTLYSATVVAGIKVNLVSVTKDADRFDTKTGEKSVIQEHSHYELNFAGVKIATLPRDAEICIGEGLFGATVFSSSNEELEDFILGKACAKTGDLSYGGETSTIQNEGFSQEFTTFLTANNLSSKVEAYLVGYAG